MTADDTDEFIGLDTHNSENRNLKREKEVLKTQMFVDEQNKNKYLKFTFFLPLFSHVKEKEKDIFLSLSFSINIPNNSIERACQNGVFVHFQNRIYRIWMPREPITEKKREREGEKF